MIQHVFSPQTSVCLQRADLTLTKHYCKLWRENPRYTTFDSSQKHNALFMFKEKLPSYYRSKLLQKLYKAGRMFKCNYIPSKKGLPRKRCAMVRSTILNEITALKICDFSL